jgi:hypothetical protein
MKIVIYQSVKGCLVLSNTGAVRIISLFQYHPTFIVHAMHMLFEGPVICYVVDTGYTVVSAAFMVYFLCL